MTEPTQNPDYVADCSGCEKQRGEDRMAAALKPFGWTCTEDFWQRYYTDPWVFNLANAVERLTDEVTRLTALTDGGVSE